MKRPIETIIVVSLAVVIAGTGGYYAGVKRGQKIEHAHFEAYTRADWTTNHVLFMQGESNHFDAEFWSEHVVIEPIEWQPKVGDRVQTFFDATHKMTLPRIVTLTNVVHVGRETSESGMLVYGDGLPGVDSSWVKPAP